MVEIRFEGVEKRFKDVTVVTGLDLTIEDREFFTFVGPSGCGKSTILNMIAGLEGVSNGTIYFDGEPINGLSPGERDVAMVFQSYALYPHLSVYDNIGFSLKLKKMNKKETAGRANEAARRLGRAPAQLVREQHRDGGATNCANQCHQSIVRQYSL